MRKNWIDNLRWLTVLLLLLIRKLDSLSPDHIFEEMFCNFPKPVDWLFKLRNTIVKPFGLQGGGGFKNLIFERSDEEIILSKNDKHLGLFRRAIKD